MVVVLGVLVYRHFHMPNDAEFWRLLPKDPGARESLAMTFSCSDGGEHCPKLAPWCDQASPNGDLVRRLCAKSCGLCLGNGTAKGGFDSRRESIMDALAQAEAEDSGKKPEVRVLYVGPEREPVLVVDNFLPASVVERTVLGAAQSPLWQPSAKSHKDQWDQGQRHKTMPRDENGLFYPKGQPVEGFPGVRAPLSNRYEEFVWARMQQLLLHEKSRDILKQAKIQWTSGVVGLGITCLSPRALDVGNTKPHVDTIDAHVAFLHYLSKTDWSSDETEEAPYGGTSFYKETRTGTANFLPKYCDKLSAGGGSMFCEGTLIPRCMNLRRDGKRLPKSCEIVPEAEMKMWVTDIETPSYFAANGDEDFELQEAVPYKFNRVVMYSPKQLHDRYMDNAAMEALSCDPKQGRMTGHMFFL